MQESTSISLQESIAGRALIFVIFAFLFRGVRIAFTESFFGYTLVNSDVALRYFFYVAVVCTVGMFWGSFRNELAGSFRIKPPFLIIAAVSLFIPTPVDSTSNYYAVLVEQLIGGVRNLALLFSIFDFSVITRYKFVGYAIGSGTTLMTLVAFYLNAFWQHMSFAILYVVRNIFGVFGVPYHINIDRFEITVQSFTVYIGSQCAGVGMMTAFLILSFVALMLMIAHNHSVSISRAVWTVFFGVLVALVANMIRIIALILIGAYISADFAMTTFHSSAGAILFLLFFSLYSRIALKWVMRVR